MNNSVDFKLEYSVLENKTPQIFEPTGVIIVAGGKASRMGGINKILAPLNNIPVIIRTASAFQKHNAVCKIVVVAGDDFKGDISRLVDEYDLSKVSDIVSGGDTRQESVKNGFDALKDDPEIKNLLIHDGARPLVSAEVIDSVLKAVEEFSAAIPVVPVKDTVKIIGGMGEVLSTPKREELVAAQTPQGFTVEIYKKALENMEKDVQYTDDSSIAENAGIKVYTVKGDQKNIKITTPEDLDIACRYLENFDC